MTFSRPFQSECRILLLKQSKENIVLQAVMDEFEENREKGNLTSGLLNREKVRTITKDSIILATTLGLCQIDPNSLHWTPKDWSKRSKW